MSILSKLKVSHAVTIVGVLPSLFAVVTVAILVVSLDQKIEQGEMAQDMVKLSVLFDNVAHNFAVERGLTAGFLGSKGVNGADKVKVQRAIADKAEMALKQVTAADFMVLSETRLDTLRKGVLEELNQKQQVRDKVDALLPDNQAFNFYSEVNRRALSSIQHLILDIRSPSISRALESRLNLLWMKERVGQYRGMLNGVFASHKTTPVIQARVTSFITDEAYRAENFEATASQASLDAFNQMTQNATWKDVGQATANFLQQKDLSQVDGPSNWFAMATAKIGLIKTLADQIGQGVAELSASQTSESVWYRNFLIAIFLIVILPVMWLAYMLIRSISGRVAMINRSLSLVSSERDLTDRIVNKAEDELGQIIRNLNQHLDHLSASFGLMLDKAEDSKSSMLVLSEASQSALSQSKEQFKRTEQIAESVGEMSLTSGTISNDMQLAAKETETIQEQSTLGEERMQSILHSINGLSAEVSGGYDAVKTVTEHTQEISGILQTIESIAEQTNLLALNAAIEAARAGEQGRGFAVVADEVRSLAQRTQNSTEEIRGMIGSLVNSGRSAMASMEQCSEMAQSTAGIVSENVSMIQTLFNSIDRLNETIERVAASAEEQSQVSEVINNRVQEVSDYSHTIMKSVENTNLSANQAKQQFDHVLTEIGSYKLN